MKVASFFAGCGGLDLGFEQAGYEVVWANEFDEAIHKTYQFNHPNTYLCKSDIRKLKGEDIPDCDGFIGGPPCQSWSEGGRQLGLDDERGRLFFDYVRLIKEKHPKFFLIENVQGIINDKHFSTFLSFLSTLVCVFSITVVLLSSYFVVIGKIEIGVLFAIITILAQILQASIKVVSKVVSVQEAKAAYNRSLLIIQHPLEDNSKHIDITITSCNMLALENVTFKYPGREILLEKINLTVRTGELLSIFGRIGSGKTTIIQLIQRFYAPSEGIITFNNADINKFDLHKWRRQIKVVSQQTKLFIGTIADNISMFSDSLENVELFCKTMQLDWFFKIEDLKLHNMVDENGNNLSGGQKQLIGIARALYQSAPILVLDEPTASMDKECELEVIQLLFRLKKDMIIIMITHKPEIAKMSDKIYILDNKHMTVCDDYLLL